MIRGILIGIVVAFAALALGGYVAVNAGLMPANADGGYLPLERWAAKTSLHATIRREAPKGPPPLAATAQNLSAGVKLYAGNCAVCHGDASGSPSNIAHGLYQKAPQLAKDGVEDDPEGVTYWKVDHGIRFTGMPAFGETLNETQLWQVSLFLKHMDSLPPAVEREWKAVKNPAPSSRGSATLPES